MTDEQDPPEVLAEHERAERDVSPATRQRVLDRDNGQCQACGTAGENRLQLHHLAFRSQGGGHGESNLVTLCFRCHAALHEGRLDITYREWRPGKWSFFCRRSRQTSRT